MAMYAHSLGGGTDYNTSTACTGIYCTHTVYIHVFVSVGRQSTKLGHTKTVLPADLPYLNTDWLPLGKLLSFLLYKLDSSILKPVGGTEPIHTTY